MKEAYPGKMTEGDVIQSATESSEHGLVERESNEAFPQERKIESSTRTVTPVRPASESIGTKERPDEVVAVDAGGPSRGLVTQEELVKIWTLDKAPPPIKIHPEGEDSEASSSELSPPPSPKRQKDLLEKDNVISRPFSPIAALKQDSI